MNQNKKIAFVNSIAPYRKFYFQEYDTLEQLLKHMVVSSGTQSEKTIRDHLNKVEGASAVSAHPFEPNACFVSTIKDSGLFKNYGWVYDIICELEETIHNVSEISLVFDTSQTASAFAAYMLENHVVNKEAANSAAGLLEEHLNTFNSNLHKNNQASILLPREHFTYICSLSDAAYAKYKKEPAGEIVAWNHTLILEALPHMVKAGPGGLTRLMRSKLYPNKIDQAQLDELRSVCNMLWTAAHSLLQSNKTFDTRTQALMAILTEHPDMTDRAGEIIEHLKSYGVYHFTDVTTKTTTTYTVKPPQP